MGDSKKNDIITYSRKRYRSQNEHIKLDVDVPAPATPDIISRKRITYSLPDKKKTLNFDDNSSVSNSFGRKTKKSKQSSTPLADELKAILGPIKKFARPVIETSNEELPKESLHKQIQLFMSCMHHILGDRKFSQWKGSVIDSVIGAYLAQNVSDILSSWAFMSLAAKFPVRVASRKNAETLEKGKAQNCKRQKLIKSKHDPKLLDLLKECHQHYHTKKKIYGMIKFEMFEMPDAVDWESVRMARAGEISKAIQMRGMNNNLAKRIKKCINEMVKDFGSTNMEWIQNLPPEKAKEYLMSMYGLGLKSVECIRLLTLRQQAFPIDINAGRVAVRLGWIPIKNLQEGMKEYPGFNSIQMYLWPYLCDFEPSILYELHCQIITFGKVFCTERNPNCGECPMREECKYSASIRASGGQQNRSYKHPSNLMDIEDYGIKDGELLSIPVVKKKKKKNVLRPLSTEHQVYVLPDSHNLLVELEPREIGDSCPYLLAVWRENNTPLEEDDAVYGTLMIPARTATGGIFPLNGTFFQANEVFADDESSIIPIKVPRISLTNLSCTTLYCGSSISTICRGMTSFQVQKCFKEGFVCFRGFNKNTREPKPLQPRFRVRKNNKRTI